MLHNSIAKAVLQVQGIPMNMCHPHEGKGRIFTSAGLPSGSGFLSKLVELTGNKGYLPQTTEPIRCGGECFREGAREAGIFLPPQIDA